MALLMPFSSYRYSFHVLYVADPFFSIAPFVSFLFLLFLNKSHRRRVAWIQTGILVSGIYLCLAIFNKQVVNRDVLQSLSQQGKPLSFFSTPSPFNSLLWFVAVRDSAGYHTTYRSVFDKGPITFAYFPRNDQQADTIDNQRDITLLKNFAQGYYTFEQWSDTTVFNVLRFGQVVGWYNPRERFAFHYYLSHPQENDLVVQRGRFQRWSGESTRAFLRRMLGKSK
jgi:inner membrane protein